MRRGGEGSRNSEEEELSGKIRKCPFPSHARLFEGAALDNMSPLPLEQVFVRAKRPFHLPSACPVSLPFRAKKGRTSNSHAANVPFECSSPGNCDREID